MNINEILIFGESEIMNYRKNVEYYLKEHENEYAI